MSLGLQREMALAHDLSEAGLNGGDVAAVVERLPAVDGGEGYVVEVFNVLDQTAAVLKVAASATEALTADEVWAVRHLARTGQSIYAPSRWDDWDASDDLRRTAPTACR